MDSSFFSNQNNKDDLDKSQNIKDSSLDKPEIKDQDDQEPEIYTPEIKKEKVLDIEGSDYESSLDSVMDKDGFIKTKLNEEVIIQRISHDLYKDSTSGLRELLNNEIRACQLARDKFNTKPYIKVSFNELDRKLIIQGFNSLGITEKIFTKVLLILGNSGNMDSKAIGQFGMGFASYTTLSDIMIVQTRCLENNDQYSVMAKGGLGFQKLPKPNLQESGTKLTLTVREKTNIESLINMLTSITNTSGIKTYLELQLHENKKIAGFGSGLHELKQTTFKDIFEELNSSKNSSYLKTSLINDDVEIYLSLSADTNGNINDNRSKKIFLCNSPIMAKLDSNDHDYNDNYKEAEIDKINISSLVVNLKDERKFKPMPERERLTSEAEEKLKELIIDLYNNMIQKGIKPCHTFNSWFDHEHRNFILSNDESITRNFDDKTKEVSKILNLQIFEHQPKYRKTKYDYKELKEVIKTKKSFYFYIGKRDKRISGLLAENRPDHSLIVVHKDHTPYKNKIEKYDNAVKTLTKAGFIEAKQYLIDNKIKAKRSTAFNTVEKTYDEISVHKTQRSTNWYDRETLKDDITTIDTTEESFKDLKKDIIMVKPFSDYRSILKEIQSDYYLTVEKKELSGLKTISDIQEEIKDHKFNTNHGLKTLNEILDLTKNKKDSSIELNNEYSNNDHANKNELKLDGIIKALNFVPKVKNDYTQIHILDTANNLFKLGLVFKKLSVDYITNNQKLDHYYRSTVEELANSIEIHKDDIRKIDQYKFNDVFKFEEYLLVLKEVETKVKNQTLIKLFQLSKDKLNFKEIANDVMRLNENCS